MTCIVELDWELQVEMYIYIFSCKFAAMYINFNCNGVDFDMDGF